MNNKTNGSTGFVQNIFGFGKPKNQLPELKKQIEYPIKKKEWRNEKLLKVVQSAREIAQRQIPENRFIWGKFLVTNSLNAIVGSSGVGKSNFFRGIGLAFANGDKEYLGLPIYPVHKKVLIISSEDNADSLTAIYQDFHNIEENDPAYDNLYFITDIQNLLNGNGPTELESILKELKIDLLLIDAFSDVFNGQSSNDTNQVRKFMTYFNQLGEKYSYTTVFLHHFNKKGHDLDGQRIKSIMGSDGFLQKVRSLVLMTKTRNSETIELRLGKANRATNKNLKEVLKIKFKEGMPDFDFISFETEEVKSNLEQKRIFSEKEKNDLAEMAFKMKNETKDSYEKIAETISNDIGETLNHKTLHRWVQLLKK